MKMKVERASQTQLNALGSLKVGNLRVREPLSRMIKLNEESWTSPYVRLTMGQKWANAYIKISKGENIYVHNDKFI